MVLEAIKQRKKEEANNKEIQEAEARLNGCLDDYAFFIHGLLNLHDATGVAQSAPTACERRDHLGRPTL